MYITKYFTDSFISANTDNIAYNKSAVQISNFGGNVAGNAVDGDSSTYSDTNWAKNPYWSVDLGMDILIDHLYIRNTHSTNGELLYKSDLLMSVSLKKILRTDKSLVLSMYSSINWNSVDTVRCPIDMHVTLKLCFNPSDICKDFTTI